jgi:hypothetical protein
VLAQGAITCHHRLGDLNNSNLFLTVLEAGKSKIKVLADSVPPYRLYFCLLIVRCGGHGEREKDVFQCYLFLQKQYLHHEDPTPITSSKPNYLPEAPCPKTITLGIRIAM